MYSTDWNARVDTLVMLRKERGISAREFLDTAHRILVDLWHYENKQRWDAMTPQEQDDYFEGYADDEFLVRRRR